MADKVSPRGIGDLIAEVPVGDNKPQTIRDLFKDPTFGQMPLGAKNELFEKIRKNDHEFQKMSDEGQTAVHQKLFGASNPPQEAPQKPAGAGFLPGEYQPPTSPQAGAVPGFVPGEGPGEAQASAPAPEEPSEPTSLLGSIGKGAVKGLEQSTQMVGMFG